MSKPRFELSKRVVLEQYHTLQNVSDVVSYSSKTNPQVTPILEEHTNSMFSIHLPGELKHVKDYSRVLFLAQGLSMELLDELYAKGVRWFAIDNIADLELFTAYVDTVEEELNLLLRVKLKEHTIRTEKYYVFGMDAPVVCEKIQELRSHSKIAKLGVHYHKKTQNMAEWNLVYELEQLFDAAVLDAIDIINIGGGFPSEYKNTNTKVLPTILEKVAAFKSFCNDKQISLMVEPGRFIAAPAATLHSTIVAIHENTIILDISVYNTDMDALIVPVKLLVQGEEEKQTDTTRPYVVKGKTPCSLDLFRYRVYLPEQRVGDELIFKNAGAYNFTTNFVDLEEIETVIVE